ncbi:UNVERIFIED_CONTAM: hypothetical protein RMT77_010914 [Armadillidium vulgare]
MKLNVVSLFALVFAIAVTMVSGQVFGSGLGFRGRRVFNPFFGNLGFNRFNRFNRFDRFGFNRFNRFNRFPFFNQPLFGINFG